MLARESFLSWSIALGLSALIHFGVAGVLSGQSWTARDFVLIKPVVPVELIEPTPPPIKRDEPRQIPPPRTVLKETPPPPPVPKDTPPPPPIETKPVPPPEPPVQPPAQEAMKRADPVMEAPSAPPPNSPPAPSPTPSLPTRGVGPAVGDVSKSPSGDAPAPGSPSGAPAVASVPRSGTGPSSATSGTGTSSGTSTRGVTQWAHPRGGYQVQPSYPASARRLGVQGTVRLKVQVLANGHVGEILVETSAGHPDLDRAAAEAVRQWHFEPARKGSEPVATWVLLPVQFQLK